MNAVQLDRWSWCPTIAPALLRLVVALHCAPLFCLPSAGCWAAAGWTARSTGPQGLGCSRHAARWALLLEMHAGVRPIPSPACLGASLGLLSLPCRCPNHSLLLPCWRRCPRCGVGCAAPRARPASQLAPSWRPATSSTQWGQSMTAQRSRRPSWRLPIATACAWPTSRA
jgi:hypothetical protein